MLLEEGDNNCDEGLDQKRPSGLGQEKRKGLDQKRPSVLGQEKRTLRKRHAKIRVEHASKHNQLHYHGL